MASVTYRLYESSPGNWRKLTWSFDVKQAFEVIQGYGPEVEYDDNTIVDVYQKSSNRVAMAIYNSSYNGSTLPYYTFPRLFVNEVVLSGTAGDINNILLFKRCNTELSPPTFEFAIYSLTTKEVTLFTYPLSQAPFCSAYALSEEFVIQQYCVGTTLRRVYYDGESGIVTEDTPNSAVCGYVPPVPEVEVTEVKTIKLDRLCYNNPVFLKWRNSIGGWDQWLFGGTQTDGLTTDDIGDYQTPIWDLSTAESTSNSLGKNASNSLIVGADNLTDNQLSAIREILYSPKVYKIETNGNKQGVKVKPGTFSKETRNGRHSIEFEIILPDLYTVKS